MTNNPERGIKIPESQFSGVSQKVPLLPKQENLLPFLYSLFPLSF